MYKQTNLHTSLILASTHTYSPLLDKLSSILEVTSNVLHQASTLLLLQHIAIKVANL